MVFLQMNHKFVMSQLKLVTSKIIITFVKPASKQVERVTSASKISTVVLSIFCQTRTIFTAPNSNQTQSNSIDLNRT